ncbi:MAG: hypothetical protein K2J11_11860 [Oscillospiraceae bacterium]|nr:hypothetical protein [Oscillospiraceae bacterium]
MSRTTTRGSGRVRSPSKCSRISHPLHRFKRYAPAGAGGDFALLLKLTLGQLRPKGSALWTSAAFEKAGETFP